MSKRLHVKYPFFSSDFNEIWIFSTDFRKSLKYQVSSKSLQWEPSCSMRTDGHDEAKSRYSQCRTIKTKNQVQRTRDFSHSSTPALQHTLVSFPGVKRPGRGVDHPHASSAEVKERVELYLYSPTGPSWPVLGRSLPSPLRV